MVNGWIILDKPAGMTSTKAGALIKRHLKIKKLGHAGTLDPFATGILPLALGEGTKTIPYVVEGKKKYRFEIVWGESRTTEDIEGQVIETSTHRPTTESILKILPKFQGLIDQIPPIYSALKIDGKRAYERARQGEEVIMKPRQVKVYDIHLEDSSSLHSAIFEVTCGPGTYVRSLGRDIAQSLGTCGYLKALRRLEVGKFNERYAISVEKILEMSHKSIEESVLLSIGAVLDDIPAVPVSEADAARIRCGLSIPSSSSLSSNMTVVLKLGEEVIALGQCEGTFIYPRRVFNT